MKVYFINCDKPVTSRISIKLSYFQCSCINLQLKLKQCHIVFYEKYIYICYNNEHSDNKHHYNKHYSSIYIYISLKTFPTFEGGNKIQLQLYVNRSWKRLHEYVRMPQLELRREVAPCKEKV